MDTKQLEILKGAHEITTRDMAKLHDRTEQTVILWIKNGWIDARKIGNYWFIKYDDAVKFVVPRRGKHKAAHSVTD